MWSLLYLFFTVFLYTLGFVCILFLGLTAPIWIGPLALILGVGWIIDQVKEAFN